MTDEQKGIFKNLGIRIRELRIQQELTQQQLGEQSGLTSKYVSEVERGLRNPSLSTLYKIANAGLHTNLAVLMFRIDEMDQKLILTKSNYSSAFKVTNKNTSKKQKKENKQHTKVAEPDWNKDGILHLERVDGILAGRSYKERSSLLAIFNQIAELLNSPNMVQTKSRRVRNK